MAVTGLMMIAFLIGHMLGNLQLFAGPAKINEYAASLRKLGPLLWLVRGGLLAALVLHVVAAIQLTQRKLALMATELTKAQLLAMRLAQLKDAGAATPAQISMAKRNNVAMAIELARTTRDNQGFSRGAGPAPDALARHWDQFGLAVCDGILFLAGLSQSLEFLAATALTGLLIVGFTPHFLAKAAPLAELAEAANRFLDGLASTNP